MRTKPKTIKLAKIRRQLRVLARTKYKGCFNPVMDNDIRKIAIKVYDIIRGEK